MMTLFGHSSEVFLPESTYSSLSGSSLLLNFHLSYEKFPSFWVRSFESQEYQNEFVLKMDQSELIFPTLC